MDKTKKIELNEREKIIYEMMKASKRAGAMVYLEMTDKELKELAKSRAEKLKDHLLIPERY